MIDPELQTVSSLLKEECQFVVPDYQRPYSWTNEEVGELIEDVSDYVGREHGLYLGSIIIDVSGKKRRRIDIVDGQQRLTTLFLMLIACRDHARSIGALDRAHATQQKITLTDELENKSIGMKLVASPTIRPLFEYMADSGWQGDFPQSLGKLAVRKLRPVYEAFRDRLKPLNAAKLHALQSTIYSTQLMRINIDSADEAFSIFERTNARGMDLEVADLLKNFLHQKKIKSIREDWPSIVKNASHSMLRMLKAFYVSYRGYVQKADLYKCLKNFSEEMGGAEIFLRRLLEFSEYYAYLRLLSTNPEETKEYFESIGLTGIAKHQDRFVEVHQCLQALGQFKVVQAQPVIFAAILCINRLKLQKDSETAKTFVRLLRALESYHFVNTYVCSHIGNEIEHVYADTCKGFRSAAKFGMAVDKLIATLRNKRAPLSEFRESFIQIEYSEKGTGKLSYIFDRHNNLGRKVGERRQIFYPDATMFRRHYNVEHIEPQNPQIVKGVSNPLPSSRINNIGNLTVLTTQLNSLLGNKPAEEKFALMKDGLAKRIVELPSLVLMTEIYGTDPFMWNDSVIERRAQQLAELSYQKVWPL
jgi:hypothetical protein